MTDGKCPRSQSGFFKMCFNDDSSKTSELFTNLNLGGNSSHNQSSHINRLQSSKNNHHSEQTPIDFRVKSYGSAGP